MSPSFPPDSPLRLPFTHGVCALRSHGLVASSRLLSTLQGPIEMPLPLGRDLDSSQQAAASLQAPGGEMSGVNDVGRGRVRPSETHPSTSWPLTGGGGKGRCTSLLGPTSPQHRTPLLGFPGWAHPESGGLSSILVAFPRPEEVILRELQVTCGLLASDIPSLLGFKHFLTGALL